MLLLEWVVSTESSFALKKRIMGVWNLRHGIGKHVFCPHYQPSTFVTQDAAQHLQHPKPAQICIFNLPPRLKVQRQPYLPSSSPLLTAFAEQNSNPASRLAFEKDNKKLPSQADRTRQKVKQNAWKSTVQNQTSEIHNLANKPDMTLYINDALAEDPARDMFWA